MDDGESTGLRQSLDEGAGDIGESTAADLPDTVAEVRGRLPATVDTVLDAGRSTDDVTLEKVLEGTPLAGVFTPSRGDEEASADD